VTAPDGTTECAPAGTVENGLEVPVCTCKGADGCHGPCFRVACDQGFSCVPTGPYKGNCFDQNNCNFFGCPSGQACVDTACVDSPCAADNTCAADEVCKPNAAFDAVRCVASCADVSCNAGEACHEGACEATGCGVDCPTGEVCLPGGADGGSTCGASPCPIVSGVPACNDGSYCEPTTGACTTDPCIGVICPGTDQSCYQGECILTKDLPGSGGAGGAGGTGGAAGTGGATTGGTGGATSGGTGGTGGASGGTGGAVDAGVGGQGTGNVYQRPSREVIGLATGGGGCRCGVPSRRTSNEAWLLAAIAMGAIATRRRARKEGGAR
jgi:hypothetical protein